ncbi:hypothetical protein DWX69_07800 [Thomasclavelia ramosa]|nr:hypothetical protein DWX69_07800 [Thomasclavelia ramosa]
MRDTILTLEDQRQALLLLTAYFSLRDSLKQGCPFPFRNLRNPTRGYHYAVRDTAGTKKGAERT